MSTQISYHELKEVNERLRLRLEQAEVLLQSHAILRATEERLPPIVEQAPVGMCHCSPDGKFVYGNRAFCDIVGYELDELRQKSWQELTPPEDLEAELELGERVLSGELPSYTLEKRYWRKDGSTAWVLLTRGFIRELDGAVRLSVGVTVDITERKRAEAALRKREERQLFAQRNANVGIWEWNTETGVEEWPPELNALYGVAPGTIKTYQDWRKRVHPEDIARVEAERHIAIAARSQFDLEFRIIHSSGEIRWIASIGKAAYGPNGEVLRLTGINLDITARKQMEIALRQSEERCRNLFDTLLEGYCMVELVFDYTGKPVDCFLLEINQAFERQSGLKNVKGRLVRELVPDLESAWLEILGKVVTTGEAVSFEKEVSALGRTWEVRAHRIGDPVNRRVGIVFNDVTERKRAEASLRQNAALFSKLVEQAPAGVYVIDSQMRLQQVNKLAAPYFSNIQPLTGCDIATAMTAIWGPELGGRITNIFRHTLETGERYISSNFVEQRHDVGEVQAFEWEAQRVTLADGQYGVVCYFADVTERKRTEETLRAGEAKAWAWADELSVIIQSFPAITFLAHEPSCRTMSCSRATRKFLRLTEGMSPSKSAPPLEAPHHFRVLQDGRELQTEQLPVQFAAATGREVRNVTLTIAFDDGTESEIFGDAVPLFDKAGNVCGALGAFTDITERKNLEAALKDADRRKDEFLATLAHELRNPLAPIRTGLQLLRRAENESPLVAQIRPMMERQLAQVVRLIDDLMDVSRISHGKIELIREKVQLAPVLHSAVESIRPLMANMKHELTAAIPDDPIVIDGDAARLSQILMNLLTNAAKYTEPGGHIWLSLERQGHDAIVSIRDTGIGIDPGQLSRIFEMFTQVGTSINKSQGGLGIGLTLVQRLVELHGGSVEARSSGPGKGSEFIVRFPILIESSNSQSPRADDAADPQLALRILVVDDNRDGADSMAMMLRLMGNVVRTAYDGQAGVDAVLEFQPDIAIFDIGLPKLDGYEACRLIRAQPWGKTSVLIALTGYGKNDDRRRALEAGFDHHLVKPLDPQALMKLLAEYEIARN